MRSSCSPRTFSPSWGCVSCTSCSEGSSTSSSTSTTESPRSWFIGIKLIIHALHSSDWEFLAWGHSIPEVPTWLSLTVIVLAMAVATVASLMKMKKDGISFKDVSADQSNESEEA